MGKTCCVKSPLYPLLRRHGKLPVKKALLSEEDEELLALVRKRINDPKEMFEEVTLDDL